MDTASTAAADAVKRTPDVTAGETNQQIYLPEATEADLCSTADLSSQEVAAAGAKKLARKAAKKAPKKVAKNAAP